MRTVFLPEPDMLSLFMQCSDHQAHRQSWSTAGTGHQAIEPQQRSGKLMMVLHANPSIHNFSSTKPCAAQDPPAANISL